MSGTLYLPESAKGYAEARQADSEISRENRQLLEELEHTAGNLDYYNRELYHIDRGLKVIMAKPNTQHPDLKPGYYHLIRSECETCPTMLKVWEGPDGEWRDLDSSIFEWVKEADMWNDRTQRELRNKARQAEQARQRAQNREAMDRAHDFDERLYNATHVQISVPRSL